MVHGVRVDRRQSRDEQAEAVLLACEAGGHDLADNLARYHVGVPYPLVPVGVGVWHEHERVGCFDRSCLSEHPPVYLSILLFI